MPIPLKWIKNSACMYRVLYVAVLVCFFSGQLLLAGKSNDTIPDKDTRDIVDVNDTIEILGVGDIMLGTDYPSTSYLPAGNDCYPLLKDVKSIIAEADVSFGNLEGVLAGNRGIAKKCNNPSLCYVFRMPVEYIDCLVDAGFDLLSVANNHSGDFGQGGRENTIEVLTKAGIGFAGFRNCPYYIFEKQGYKIGFCAFSPHSGTVSIKNITGAKAIVSELEEKTDMVVVSFHGGAEGSKYQHVTRKDEVFLGYNRGNVYEFAHAVIDAGADIVFGHGPHVTRAVELYRNRFIAYSLGNFCTYARFNLRGPNGIAPIIKIKTDKKGNFINGHIIPVCQVGEGITKIDDQLRAIKKIQELTTIDFPDSEILIQDNGAMMSKNMFFFKAMIGL